MLNEITGSQFMLKGHAKNNCYAWFDTGSYHSSRKTHFNARVGVKLRQSQWSVKCRSRAPGHGAC